ncbi:MAG TPA: pyrroline-5-carboxylate reductase dimerization domain-containing protein [Pyrinomonadaceae bacterium]
MHEKQFLGFRLGLLGAGRLGETIAKTWFRRTGEVPLVWSRSGASANGVPRIPDSVWVDDWTKVLQARSIIIALPGKALLELAEVNEQARNFEGIVFSAAASLSLESLRRVFPMATVVCIAPFLIDGRNSIPTLVLRSPHLQDSQWDTATAELKTLGDIDVVYDEELFAQMSLLGASWPVIVVAAIQAACEIGMKGLDDERAIGIARHVFFRAMQTLLSNSTHEPAASHVATPGGITERGLNHIGELSRLFECAFAEMRTRAKELNV